MPSPIRIAQVGLGPLGLMLTPYLLERSGIELVSAIDIDPAKLGCDLGEVSACGQTLGIAIGDDLDKGLTGVDLAVVTTVSELQRIAPTLKKNSQSGRPCGFHLRRTFPSVGNATRIVCNP